MPTSPNRRQFLKTASATALSASFASSVFAAPSKSSTAETAVQEFYETLTDKQRAEICFGFDHNLRNKISANWHITKPNIGDDFYTDQQRAVIDKIIRGMCSEDGYKRVQQQMDEDDGGVNFYSVAVFGQPGSEKFEFELTGRHLTMRADGNSVDKAAFGGPIVYGHGEPDTKDNLYYYQTQQTHKVFEALDASQRKLALLNEPPKENQVQFRNGEYPGLAVGEMSNDQQKLVGDTLNVLLAPYREEDRAEVRQILDGIGGPAKLNMAFYQKGDLNNDKTWDIWRIEGPGFVWHFRGAPHVHAYINIAAVS